MLNKDLVSQRFNELKHFDMTTMGYYANMEWENYNEIARHFNNITYTNGYTDHYLLDKKMKNWFELKKRPQYVFRYFEPNNEYYIIS